MGSITTLQKIKYPFGEPCAWTNAPRNGSATVDQKGDNGLSQLQKELDELANLRPDQQKLQTFFRALITSSETNSSASFPSMHHYFSGAQFRTLLRAFLVSHNYAVYNGQKGQMRELTQKGKAFMQEYINQHVGVETVVRTANHLQETVKSIVGEIIMNRLGGSKYRKREQLISLIVEEIQGSTEADRSDLTAQQVRERCKTLLMALASQEGMNLQKAWPKEFPPVSQTPDQTPSLTPDQNP